MSLDSITGWLVWVIPLISSLFVPLISKFSAKARNYFVVLIAAITTGLALSMVPGVFFGSGEPTVSSVVWFAGINAGVFIDPLSVLFTSLVAFFGLIIAVYSLGYMAHEEGLTRYYFLLLLFIGSMIGLVISDNLLQMFIFWEMVGLCSFTLISFWYKRPESVKAGTKVFIMTRIGDIALLGAIALVYVSLGTFSFREIIAGISSIPIPTLTAIAFLTLGGAIAKSAQLPLHTWLYSAMEAPTSVSALLHSATMVKAGIYLIARFILIIGPLAAALPYWLPTIAWIGVLTAIVGATLAFYTNDIKGVLAYSTISQLGFMMAALGTASSASSLGWFASLYHMMSHAFFEGLGFLLAGGIIHALGTRDMRLMGGLKKAMPITFILAVIMIITTSGLPPFAAFFSKGLIITSISETGNLVQTIILFATTMLTFAYSLRFMALIFMGKESDHITKMHPHEAPKTMLYPAIVLAILCVVWGVAQPLVASFMHVELEISLVGAFVNLETPIFLSLLLPTGLLIYYTYYKTSSNIRTIVSGKNPITTILSHGYFFDDIYNAIAKGITKVSNSLGHFEDKYNLIPQKVASGFFRFASAVHSSFDVATDQFLNVIATRSISGASEIHKFDVLLDKFLSAIGNKTVSGASEIKRKTPSTSLQHYIAAAVLGFVLIVILIILTMGV
ncbi:MAG: NADH-quinone oxidoreductase subunit L [Candidatus Bathyarchaeota archaeon]|nr:NADH-quinone oxidoreductase subunit L [Candidatus Bathyarchaeota archaeon]